MHIQPSVLVLRPDTGTIPHGDKYRAELRSGARRFDHNLASADSAPRCGEGYLMYIVNCWVFGLVPRQKNETTSEPQYCFRYGMHSEEIHGNIQYYIVLYPSDSILLISLFTKEILLVPVV